MNEIKFSRLYEISGTRTIETAKQAVQYAAINKARKFFGYSTWLDVGPVKMRNIEGQEFSAYKIFTCTILRPS